MFDVLLPSAGPYHAEAVQLFIKAFQKWLEDTHLHTEHDINRLRVVSDLLQQLAACWNLRVNEVLLDCTR